MRLINADELLKQRPFTIIGGTLSDYTEGYLNAIEAAVNCIRNFPTAGIAEVRRGKWIEDKDCDGRHCSECGEDYCYLVCNAESYNYCPNCGARMDYEA